MKIKILTMPFGGYNIFMPPLSLGIISHKLQQNNVDHDIDDLAVKTYHEEIKGNINLDFTNELVSLFERYIDGENLPEVESIIRKIADLTELGGYDLLLFSSSFEHMSKYPDYLIPQALLRYVKKKHDVEIVVNEYALLSRKEEYIDKVVPTIPELSDYLSSRLNRKIVFDNDDYKQSLHGLPLELYEYQQKKVAAYKFFDGCPFRCNFCSRFFNDDPSKEKFEYPNVEKVVKDIKSFSEKYDFDSFLFLNTTINPSRQFGESFAKAIIKNKLKIKWMDCANFNNMDIELLDLLKKSGCVSLTFGLETSSKSLQKKINKNLDLEHVEKILKHCYDIGIWAQVTIIVGLPYESYEDICHTLKFIKKNYIYLRGINVNRFVLMEESNYYKNPEEHKIKLVSLPNYSFYEYSRSVPYKKEGIVNKNKMFTWYDETEGISGESRLNRTLKIYDGLHEAIDKVRIDRTRPVHHVFRVFSNKTTVENINNYINKQILNNDLSKIVDLIRKYTLLSRKENNTEQTEEVMI